MINTKEEIHQNNSIKEIKLHMVINNNEPYHAKTTSHIETKEAHLKETNSNSRIVLDKVIHYNQGRVIKDRYNHHHHR